jgi:hypothetical protein
MISCIRDKEFSSIRDKVFSSIREKVFSSIRDKVFSSIQDKVFSSIRDKVFSKLHISTSRYTKNAYNKQLAGQHLYWQLTLNIFLRTYEQRVSKIPRKELKDL